jgi:hypothetical protein
MSHRARLWEHAAHNLITVPKYFPENVHVHLLCISSSEYLESFEIWCWRRMEISCTDYVRNKKYYRESRRRGISYKK